MKVDLIIKNGNVYNSYFKKFFKEDIIIKDGLFLHIGDDYEDRIICENIIDAENKYIIPGLIDIHMHIESSMTIPSEFSKVVMKYGVTTVVADPHEIANVFGIRGIETFIDENTELDIFYGIPSSVPSTSKDLETTGCSITTNEVMSLMKNKKIRCLGEVMNFKDLTSEEDTEIKRIIKHARNYNSDIVLEGHCPKISGMDLSLFLYSGVNGDHTQQDVSSLKEKIKRGMFIEIQHKSINKENIEYIVENNLYEHIALVTDDVMADKINDGHLNLLIKEVVSLGMNIEDAIYISTFTPARRMGFQDRGSIASGKIADFMICDDIDNFNIESVYKDGNVVYIDKNKSNNITINDRDYKKTDIPREFFNSIKLEMLKRDDFSFDIPNKDKITCRVMNVNSNSTFTQEQFIELDIVNGKLQFAEKDCALIAVFERYGNGNKSFGLVNGNIIKKGALATTWAHDHHNLMVMGYDIDDMIEAANSVISMKGGYSVCNDKKIISSVELPIGGIISDEPIEKLGEKLKNVRKAIKSLGYNHINEIMSFSTLSLPVSPELKITDKGLIKVKENKIVSLFV